jgi:SAM-dependent methyltransferase
MNTENALQPQAGDTAAREYALARRGHWDDLARTSSEHAGAPRRAYHRRLAEIYAFLIPPGRRVLEIGCGEADLLAAVRPGLGVGIDFSAPMLQRGCQRHPQLHLVQADAHELPVCGEFDFIILSDLINDLWDVQRVLEECRRLCSPRTRLIVNWYSRLWEAPLRLARGLGLARKTLEQNWLTWPDASNLMELAGFQAMRRWREVLCPLPLPLVSGLLNRVAVRVPPVTHLALANFLLARPGPTLQDRPPTSAPQPRVSVIVPARNEAGNIPDILRRVPEMGGGTQIVFVEGHSTDSTYDAIQQALTAQPGRWARLDRQSGKGKGDAVRLGFEKAEGDILMVLDADLTVAPEDLPRFYRALVSGQGEFINGVRLVYPMEERAMQPLNLVGNRFFGLAFSWVMGQSVRDTLCGTKVLWRRDYELIAQNRSYFGDFDPFGDFDLLFGAARLNLRIVDLPIRYRERTYGSTNISRWKHGWLLLRMLGFAAVKLKFC